MQTYTHTRLAQKNCKPKKNSQQFEKWANITQKKHEK